MTHFPDRENQALGSEILQIAPLLLDEEQLQLVPPSHVLLDRNAALAWMVDNGRGVRAVITNSLVGLPDEAWDLLPNLELVANIGAGLEHINVELARSRGVRVTHTPDILTDDVADVAIGLSLCLLRRLVEGDAFVRSGRWGTAPYSLGTSFAGRRLGILGLGRIGRAIGLRAEVFKMEVGYHSRHRRADRWAFFDDLKALAIWADILVVAVPGGVETTHMVDAGVLGALGPRGYLVNIARGAIIDEAALLTALHDGVIAGAALDVFEGEPAINPAFLSAPRTILSPHIGSATSETRKAMAEHAFQNVRFLLGGKPLRDEVTAV